MRGVNVVDTSGCGDAFCAGQDVIEMAAQATGGDFGVIHQPIHVPENLRGEVISAHMAAAVVGGAAPFAIAKLGLEAQEEGTPVAAARKPNAPYGP